LGARGAHRKLTAEHPAPLEEHLVARLQGILHLGQPLQRAPGLGRGGPAVGIVARGRYVVSGGGGEQGKEQTCKKNSKAHVWERGAWTGAKLPVNREPRPHVAR